MRRIITPGTLVFIALIAAFMVSAGAQAQNDVYLLPEQGTAQAGATAAVEIWVNATGFKSGQINLTYDSGCANVTNFVWNATNFPMSGWTHYEGSEWITFLTMQPSLTGNYQIGTLTIQCLRGDCGTRLQFVQSGEKRCKLGDSHGTEIPTDWIDGIFDCTSTGDVFDTRSGTYPSIFGTHNGTITPYQDVNVNTMYTYPCPGTGGHTEYVLIYNESGPVAEAHWHGYNGDYLNITFNTTKLLARHTYNYTIRTGSYPQIHHMHELPTDDGIIICDGFTDANGRTYDNWIPAIRLFLN